MKVFSFVEEGYDGVGDGCGKTGVGADRKSGVEIDDGKIGVDADGKSSVEIDEDV